MWINPPSLPLVEVLYHLTFVDKEPVGIDLCVGSLIHPINQRPFIDKLAGGIVDFAVPRTGAGGYLALIADDILPVQDTDGAGYLLQVGVVIAVGWNPGAAAGEQPQRKPQQEDDGSTEHAKQQERQPLPDVDGADFPIVLGRADQLGDSFFIHADPSS